MNGAFPTQLLAELQAFLLLCTSLINIGDSPVPDTISWLGNATGVLSINDAWNLLRTKVAATSWFALIWNKFLNPHLTCPRWRLLHRKTPTDNWTKLRGWSLASRCHNRFTGEETYLDLFFSCNLAQLLWNWLFSPCRTQLPSSLSASTIWKTIATAGDVHGRNCAAAIFFHAIFAFWSIRNDSKRSSKKPSLERVKVILLDRLKGMAIYVQGVNLPPHPILAYFGFTC
ncbi:hypothetical protein AAC387_Pa08g1490 [Persea americana]